MSVLKLLPMIWGIVFLFALLPGTLLGWLIGKISVPTPGCVAFAVSLSLFVGLLIAANIFGELTTSHHAEGTQLTLILLVPPMLLPMLIGIWINRAKVRTGPAA